MTSLDKVQSLIKEECDGVKDLLIEKNKKYGNSAIEPKRIFSSSNSIEQIKVRIDDKLSRIQNATNSESEVNEDEDVELDLIGYLILLRVAKKIQALN